MNTRVLAIFSVAVLAVLIAGGIVWVRLHPSRQLNNASSAPVNAALVAGDVAPQFTIPSTQGPFDLNAQTKPVFLEIFATWCPHCQRETKVLNALYAVYKSRVAFIAVPGSDTAMDGTSPESQFDVMNFAIRFSVKYPIALYDPNLTIARQYLQGGFPTLVIIGEDKKIAYINSGEVSQKDLAAALNATLR